MPSAHLLYKHSTPQYLCELGKQFSVLCSPSVPQYICAQTAAAPDRLQIGNESDELEICNKASSGRTMSNKVFYMMS